jgi:hypothetical protein
VIQADGYDSDNSSYNNTLQRDSDGDDEIRQSPLSPPSSPIPLPPLPPPPTTGANTNSVSTYSDQDCCLLSSLIESIQDVKYITLKVRLRDLPNINFNGAVPIFNCLH